MTFGEKVFLWVVVCGILFFSVFHFFIQPAITHVVNKQQEAVIRVDDSTNYKTAKEIEDTLRAMMAAYEIDKTNTKSYNAAGKSEWALQSSIRVNTTVESYKQYYEKWVNARGVNLPDDIPATLPRVEFLVTDGETKVAEVSTFQTP